jgi:isopentenyl-diphosphate Delta-isomerase
MKNLILVNKNDKQIGQIRKLEAHLNDGQLHRAFTAILQNDKDEILLTQRSLKKPLWPTFWDGSFSSHPWDGEALEIACSRRAYEELGIKVNNFKKLFSYEYHIRWNEIFSEYEINHILLGKYNGSLKLNSEEISNYKWLSWQQVLDWIKKEPEIMASWWAMAVEKIKKEPQLLNL